MLLYAQRPISLNILFGTFPPELQCKYWTLELDHDQIYKEHNHWFLWILKMALLPTLLCLYLFNYGWMDEMGLYVLYFCTG